MADGNERVWWRRTRFLAIFTMTAGIVVTLFFLVSAPVFDRQSVLGIPFGLFGVTLLAPLAILALVAWAAESQRRIDRLHGFEE